MTDKTKMYSENEVRSYLAYYTNFLNVTNKAHKLHHDIFLFEEIYENAKKIPSELIENDFFFSERLNKLEKMIKVTKHRKS